MRAVKLTAVTLLLFAFLFSSTAISQGKPESKATGGKVTLKGEVLDLACYVAQGAKGAEHKKCADACVKGGAPIGILTEDGKVYLCVEDHKKSEPYEKLKGFAAEKVSVTGTVYNRGGLQGIVVEAVEPAK